MIDYEIMLSELLDKDIESAIEVLFKKLPDLWCEKYLEMTPTVICPGGHAKPNLAC